MALPCLDWYICYCNKTKLYIRRGSGPRLASQVFETSPRSLSTPLSLTLTPLTPRDAPSSATFCVRSQGHQLKHPHALLHHHSLRRSSNAFLALLSRLRLSVVCPAPEARRPLHPTFAERLSGLQRTLHKRDYVAACAAAWPGLIFGSILEPRH